MVYIGTVRVDATVRAVSFGTTDVLAPRFTILVHSTQRDAAISGATLLTGLTVFVIDAFDAISRVAVADAAASLALFIRRTGCERLATVRATALTGRTFRVGGAFHARVKTGVAHAKRRVRAINARQARKEWPALPFIAAFPVGAVSIEETGHTSSKRVAIPFRTGLAAIALELERSRRSLSFGASIAAAAGEYRHASPNADATYGNDGRQSSLDPHSFPPSTTSGTRSDAPRNRHHSRYFS